jgi:hypothetical protein
MNTMLAPSFGKALPPRGLRIGFVGWSVVFLACGTVCSQAARAQDVAAAVPATSGEALNSLLGRIAPATLASTAPRVTLEHNRLLETERALAPNNGLDVYGRPLVELGGVTYRWWVTHGASNFGVGVGAVGYVVPSMESAGGSTLAYNSSVLTLGWRYQLGQQSAVFADASGARRFSAGATDRYSTKVGVEWKARSNKFGLDGASRSLALQMDSGYKMSLRLR